MAGITFYKSLDNFLINAKTTLEGMPAKDEMSILEIFQKLPLERTSPLRSPSLDVVIGELKQWANEQSQRPDFDGAYQIETSNDGRIYLGVELKSSIRTFIAYPTQDGWLYWY